MELGRFWWLASSVLFAFCIHGCFGCWEEERIALLQFKASSDYPDLWPLSSSSSTDCCSWKRVHCHNTTGRVIRLHLDSLKSTYNWDDYDRISDNWYLNASLFLPFQELNYLDLSNNEFFGWVSNEGLERFSEFSKREELSLDWNYIYDSFLSSIGAIASLRKLHLEHIHTRLSLAHVSVLGRLNNLQELYLDGSQPDESILQRAGVMTSLNVLSMLECGLQGRLPDKGWCDLSNLKELDLGDNDLEGMLPSCLANMTALRLLGLASNHLKGGISHISSLPSLEYLDLSNNHFAPISFSSFSNISRFQYTQSP